MTDQPRDEGLEGNEKIEQAVAALQQETTQEQLAHTLTVIRRRMREGGGDEGGRPGAVHLSGRDRPAV